MSLPPQAGSVLSSPLPSTASHVPTTEDADAPQMPQQRAHSRHPNSRGPPRRLPRAQHTRPRPQHVGLRPQEHTAGTTLAPGPAAQHAGPQGRGSPDRCRPRVGSGPGLGGLPAAARSRRRPWSARHSSSCSRSENSSPGSSWRLHTEQRKHSMWYTLSRARITRSLLLKPTWHLAHLMPNSLRARAGRSARGCGRGGPRGRSPHAGPRAQLPAASPDVVPLAVGLPVSHEARARLVQVLAALGALEAGGVPLEVWGHPQDELVVDLTPAAHARGRAGLLCGEGRTSGRLRTSPAARQELRPPGEKKKRTF